LRAGASWYHVIPGVISHRCELPLLLEHFYASHLLPLKGEEGDNEKKPCKYDLKLIIQCNINGLHVISVVFIYVKASHDGLT